MLASKSAAYTVMILAGLLGRISLLVFMVFLFLGSLNIVDLDLGTAAALFLDAGLCLLFFIQHSVMVRKSFRRWMSKFIPEAYGSAIYAICSGLALLALVVLWQRTTPSPIKPHGMYRAPFYAVFLLSLVGFAWGVRALKFFDPFGIRPVRHLLRGTEPKPARFVVSGPYRWVRHPLYLFMILIIWACPNLTFDKLLFNIFWTTWIVTVGTIMEERDLVAEFGEAYRAYQRKAPMLFPLHRPLPLVQEVDAPREDSRPE